MRTCQPMRPRPNISMQADIDKVWAAPLRTEYRTAPRDAPGTPGHPLMTMKSALP